jgi:hypothetical protein
MRIIGNLTGTADNGLDFLQKSVTSYKTCFLASFQSKWQPSMWKLPRATELWQDHLKGNAILEVFWLKGCHALQIYIAAVSKVVPAHLWKADWSIPRYFQPKRGCYCMTMCGTSGAACVAAVSPTTIMLWCISTHCTLLISHHDFYPFLWTKDHVGLSFQGLHCRRSHMMAFRNVFKHWQKCIAAEGQYFQVICVYGLVSAA